MDQARETPKPAPQLLKPPPLKWRAFDASAFSTASLAQPAVSSVKLYHSPTRCSSEGRNRSPSSKSSKVGAVPVAASEQASTEGGGALVSAEQLGTESLP